MEELAVPGGSSITAGQWIDFWTKYDLKKINGRNFQAFLDEPNKFLSPVVTGLVSLSGAKKILGRDKVVTVTNYNKVWETEFPDFPIYYSTVDLMVAKRNNSSGHDWRLVFYGGQSIRQLRDRFGIDPNIQPHFNNQSWYLEEVESLWASKTVPAPGYYLIDFMAQHYNLKPKELIGIAGLITSDIERTDPHIFTETLFTVFKLSGERLAEKWLHLTATKTAKGWVAVGLFTSNGYYITNYPPANNIDTMDHLIRFSVYKKQKR